MIYSNWDSFAEAVEDGSIHDLKPGILRSVETTARYEAFKASLPRRAFLNRLKREIDEATQYWYGVKYAITKNEYPYDELEFADHFLLWTDAEPYEAEEIAKLNYPDKVFILLEQPNGRKTVPEFRHYHIFINNGTTRRTSCRLRRAYSAANTPF